MDWTRKEDPLFSIQIRAVLPEGSVAIWELRTGMPEERLMGTDQAPYRGKLKHAFSQMKRKRTDARE